MHIVAVQGSLCLDQRTYRTICLIHHICTRGGYLLVPLGYFRLYERTNDVTARECSRLVDSVSGYSVMQQVSCPIISLLL